VCAGTALDSFWILDYWIFADCARSVIDVTGNAHGRRKKERAAILPP